jgi:hypothetical protein
MRLFNIYLFTLLGLVAVLTGCADERPSSPQATETLAAAFPLITVHKTPSCGCCSKWVEHLRDSGFEVTAEDHSSLAGIKQQLAVPQPLRSCHTATVDGYVIEGHVPAEDLQRLLRERPTQIAGLAVPGMPLGSPGMEHPQSQPYQTVAWHRAGGATEVFAQHGPQTSGDGHDDH